MNSSNTRKVVIQKSTKACSLLLQKTRTDLLIYRRPDFSLTLGEVFQQYRQFNNQTNYLSGDGLSLTAGFTLKLDGNLSGIFLLWISFIKQGGLHKWTIRLFWLYNSTSGKCCSPIGSPRDISNSPWMQSCCGCRLSLAATEKGET